MRFPEQFEMTSFEQWLFREPWRLERYFNMIPNQEYSETQKEQLRNEFQSTRRN